MSGSFACFDAYAACVMFWWININSVGLFCLCICGVLTHTGVMRVAGPNGKGRLRWVWSCWRKLAITPPSRECTAHPRTVHGHIHHPRPRGTTLCRSPPLLPGPRASHHPQVPGKKRNKNNSFYDLCPFFNLLILYLHFNFYCQTTGYFFTIWN